MIDSFIIVNRILEDSEYLINFLNDTWGSLDNATAFPEIQAISIVNYYKSLGKSTSSIKMLKGTISIEDNR